VLSTVREREREKERERKREGGREREREKERVRKRERELLFSFLKGMTGALAPFSYLVFNKNKNSLLTFPSIT
jgi:hypothetical protein